MFHGESEAFNEGAEKERYAFAWSLFLKAPHPSSTKWE